MKTDYKYDEVADRLTVSHSYDAEPVIEQNKRERNNFTTFKNAQLKNGMVKVATLHPGDVERLKNMGYNILSSDPAEFKRALLFLQAEQKQLLTVEGKPFAKKKTQWL